METVQYTANTRAPFRNDGWGVNDADGQRIAKVEKYLRMEDRAEYDLLTNLFAAAPEMQRTLFKVKQLMDDKVKLFEMGNSEANEDLAENFLELHEEVRQVLIKSNPAFKTLVFLEG